MAYDLKEMIEEFADAFMHARRIEKEMSELKQKIGAAFNAHSEIFLADADPLLMEDIQHYLNLTATLREAELVLERHEKALKPVINLLPDKILSHKIPGDSGKVDTVFDIVEREDGRLEVTNIR